MKTLTALLAAVAIGVTTAQAEDQPLTSTFKEGRCVVEYHGGVYLTGRCSIQWRSDGAFAVSRPSREAVASVNISLFNGSPWAEIFFSADDAGHSIGYLTLEVNQQERGACWSNAQGNVCLWSDGLIELLRDSGFSPVEEAR